KQLESAPLLRLRGLRDELEELPPQRLRVLAVIEVPGADRAGLIPKEIALAAVIDAEGAVLVDELLAGREAVAHRLEIVPHAIACGEDERNVMRPDDVAHDF